LSEKGDERVGSVLYRIEMNQVYQPLAERGGLLGWGFGSIPSLPAMFSVDNEFLLIHLAYGDLGYWLFLLIVFESMRTLIFFAWRRGPREDVAFAFVLQGALLVLWLTLWTVWLGEQLPHLAFLLIGWGQAIRRAPTFEVQSSVTLKLSRRFGFSRVFQ
jgi:hypothetical protein